MLVYHHNTTRRPQLEIGILLPPFSEQKKRSTHLHTEDTRLVTVTVGLTYYDLVNP
jgi:hypothetical protein